MPSDAKGHLFGRAVIRRTGTHDPDPKELREPFAGPGEANFASVARRFCRGCGLMAEVDETIAQRLAHEAGTPFDGAVPTTIYFETTGCAWCANGETLGLVVKPMPPLPTDQN